MTDKFAALREELARSEPCLHSVGFEMPAEHPQATLCTHEANALLAAHDAACQERDRLRMKLEINHRARESESRAVVQAMQERDRLRAWLRENGEHVWSCPVTHKTRGCSRDHAPDDPDCDCGLRAALTGEGA